jgi:putative ABC transport system permease protein
MDLIRQLRMTTRTVMRRPLYPALSLVILTLGLATTVATFTYLDSYGRPFPGAEGTGLVRLFETLPSEPFRDPSFLDFEDYARESRSFDGVAATQPYYAASVRLPSLTEVAFLEAVSGSYFPVLGVGAELGRVLGPSDDRPESEPAAVISHEWWRTTFGADPGVVGQTVYLNFEPYTVVGVAPPDFLGSAADFRPRVWIPFSHFRARYTGWDRMALDRDAPLVRVYGRLAQGIGADAATEELNRIAGGLDESHPRSGEVRTIRVEEATWIDPRTRIAESSANRVMVWSAAGFLLLVCANVANILVTGVSARRRSFAIRSALGASFQRISLGIVAGNVALALLAALLGVGLAVPLSGKIGSYFERPSVWGETVTRALEVDASVVGFALAAAIVTGLVASILPVMEVRRRAIADPLRSEGVGRRDRPSAAETRLPTSRSVLTGAQVGLSIVLLVYSALLLETLDRASAVDPGFRYAQLVGSHISTSSTELRPEERERFFQEVETRIAAEPWVESATVSGNAPLSGHPTIRLRRLGEEEEVPAVQERVHVGLFQKLGIPLEGGRPFTVADSAGAPPVVILNRPAALRLFPQGDALGRQVEIPGTDGGATLAEVVGVVGDVKLRNFLDDAEPAFFLPYAGQPYPTGSALLVQSRIAPEQAIPLLQRWLREFEPHLAIVNAVSYQDVVEGAVYTQRMNAELFAVLSLMGLLLAAAGIFSVVSLSVTRRTRELGVRKALGATPAGLRRLVVTQAMRPVVAGLAAGLVAAWAGRRLVAGLLYGVGPLDPRAYLAGVLVLLVAAASAATWPAQRAGRVDAAQSLRAD